MKRFLHTILVTVITLLTHTMQAAIPQIKDSFVQHLPEHVYTITDSQIPLIPNPENKDIFELRESSRDLTFEIDPILQYWVDFERSNPEALTRSNMSLFSGFGIISPYLQNLEELGYCVIPQILSAAEAEILYQRVWHEFIEKAWPDCRIDNRSNWQESFPIHNKMGIFVGPAGQTQVMWDLRQDPRIVDIFAQIWNTKDLIVSMDGLSFMCPPEIREGYTEPWMHVDQLILRRQDRVAHNNNPPIDFVSESLLKTQPYTIQGQFLFEDSLSCLSRA